jgi:hypothetical protein
MSDEKKDAEATGKAFIGCLLIALGFVGLGAFLGFAFAVDWRIGVAASGWLVARFAAASLKAL